MTADELIELEREALKIMAQGRFAEALERWEQRIEAGDVGVVPFPLMALCLARVGRLNEAEKICEQVRVRLATMQVSERRSQLIALLDQVESQLRSPDAAALVPSAELDTLFAGNDGSRKR